MQTFYQLLGLIGGALILWILYRTIKSRPELLNRTNMSKSFSTMGILALVLIGFVALLVLMVRH